MLDHLIREGRLLHHRILKHFDPGVESLRPEDRISVAELDAWYKGVTRALEQHFGADSAHVRTWKDGLEQVDKDSWAQVGMTDGMDGYHVRQELLESLGLLTQIKLLDFDFSSQGRRTPLDSEPPTPTAVEPTEVRSERAERAGGTQMVGGPRLAKWLAAQMKKREHMSPNRLHELSGLDRKTIKKILSGGRVRRRLLQKLADGLAREGPSLPVSDVPTD